MVAVVVFAIGLLVPATLETVSGLGDSDAFLSTVHILSATAHTVLDIVLIPFLHWKPKAGCRGGVAEQYLSLVLRALVVVESKLVGVLA